jgi:hypothetical protein
MATQVDAALRSMHSTARSQYHLLSPLQLAAKLGDERMASHIIRKRLQLNWEWGPLTSFRIDLDEIDSVRHSNHIAIT